MHRAFQKLTDNEMRTIELRYQHKQSPGQTASRMGISREEMAALEESGLQKLRSGLDNWHQGR